MYEMEGMNNR